MRLTTKLMAGAAALMLATATAAPRATATTIHNNAIAAHVTSVATFAPTQDAKIEVKTTDTHSSGPWYTQPVWIAIGVIALVLIIVLIISAGRGRDTTVIK